MARRNVKSFRVPTQMTGVFELSHSVTVVPRQKPTMPSLTGLPLLGQLPAMRRDILGVFERAAGLGDVVRIQLPHRTGYLVNHPDGVRRVLVENHRSYGKRTRGYEVLELVLGQGLVTSHGETWKRHRQLIQPAFHHRQIRNFVGTIDDAAGRMLQRWRDRYGDGDVIEVDEEMTRITLEVVGRCLLGVDLSEASGVWGEAISVVLHETLWRMTQPLTLPLWVPTSRNSRLRRALSRMHELVQKVIQDRRAGGPEVDLVALLVAAREETTGASLSDRELLDEVMTMILAGHETTANALAWTLHFLGENPNAQERLETEADETLSDGRILEYPDLARLVFTNAVFDESLRLRPPLWIIGRSVEASDTILGHSIPKGSIVFISPYLLHQDKRFWDAPQSFDPDRFLGPDARPVSKYVYIPFAAGPRSCIGQSFAMMEAKLILGRIAQVARLESTQRPVVPEPTVTLRPKGGLPMRIRWRSRIPTRTHHQNVPG